MYRSHLGRFVLDPTMNFMGGHALQFVYIYNTIDFDLSMLKK